MQFYPELVSYPFDIDPLGIWGIYVDYIYTHTYTLGGRDKLLFYFECINNLLNFCDISFSNNTAF